MTVAISLSFKIVKVTTVIKRDLKLTSVVT